MLCGGCVEVAGARQCGSGMARKVGACKSASDGSEERLLVAGLCGGLHGGRGGTVCGLFERGHRCRRVVGGWRVRSLVACHSDANCEPGERCLASALVVTDSCVPSGIDWCYEDSAGYCNCDVLTECGYYLVCTPETVAPRSDDCPVRSVDCPDEGWEQALDSALETVGFDIRADVEACLARVQEARADCDPD